MSWMALGKIVGVVITWWQVIGMIWWEFTLEVCELHDDPIAHKLLSKSSNSDH